MGRVGRQFFERAYRLGMATAPERIPFYKAMNARDWKTNDFGIDAIPLERLQLLRGAWLQLVAVVRVLGSRVPGNR